MRNEANSQQFHRRHLLALGVQGTVVAGLGLTATPARAADQKPMATGFKHACDLTVLAGGQIAVIGDRQLAIFSPNGRTVQTQDLDAGTKRLRRGFEVMRLDFPSVARKNGQMTIADDRDLSASQHREVAGMLEAGCYRLLVRGQGPGCSQSQTGYHGSLHAQSQ